MSRERRRHRVFLSLGSNIEPVRHLTLAVERLAERLDLTQVSHLYQSPAVAESPQPEFLNAALEARTHLAPRELKFGLLRPLEAELGRRRSADRNAPRTIDLDIALYGERGEWVVEEPGVRLPDPEIATRAHVALPLAELAPDLEHPLELRPLARIAAELSASAEIVWAADSETLKRRLAALASSADDAGC